MRSEGATVAGTTRRAGATDAGVLSLDLSADAATWPELPEAGAVLLGAGETSLARCRAEPAATHRVNVDAVASLSERLGRRGTFMVFLSTNLVFDGSRPFARATDRRSPLTEYGRQKAEAEAVIRLQGEGAAVLRLSKSDAV